MRELSVACSSAKEPIAARSDTSVAESDLLAVKSAAKGKKMASVHPTHVLADKWRSTEWITIQSKIGSIPPRQVRKVKKILHHRSNSAAEVAHGYKLCLGAGAPKTLFPPVQENRSGGKPSSCAGPRRSCQAPWALVQGLEGAHLRRPVRLVVPRRIPGRGQEHLRRHALLRGRADARQLPGRGR